jgi:hypothetical protein
MTGLLAQATLTLLAGCALAGRRLGAYHRWWRRERAAQAARWAAAAPLWNALAIEVVAERRGRHSRHPDRTSATRLIDRHGQTGSPLYEALTPIERTTG